MKVAAEVVVEPGEFVPVVVAPEFVGDEVKVPPVPLPNTAVEV